MGARRASNVQAPAARWLAPDSLRRAAPCVQVPQAAHNVSFAAVLAGQTLAGFDGAAQAAYCLLVTSQAGGEQGRGRHLQCRLAKGQQGCRLRCGWGPLPAACDAPCQAGAPRLTVWRRLGTSARRHRHRHCHHWHGGAKPGCLSCRWQQACRCGGPARRDRDDLPAGSGRDGRHGVCPRSGQRQRALAAAGVPGQRRGSRDSDAGRSAGVAAGCSAAPQAAATSAAPAPTTHAARAAGPPTARSAHAAPARAQAAAAPAPAAAAVAARRPPVGAGLCDKPCVGRQRCVPGGAASEAMPRIPLRRPADAHPATLTHPPRPAGSASAHPRCSRWPAAAATPATRSACPRQAPPPWRAPSTAGTTARSQPLCPAPGRKPGTGGPGGTAGAGRGTSWAAATDGPAAVRALQLSGLFDPCFLRALLA